MTRALSSTAVALGGLLLAASAGAAEPPLLIEGATLVDVAEGRAVAGQSLLVEDGRIAAIGPSRVLHLPPDVRRVDARGLFVLPGLCDAHVHLTPSPETFGPLLLAHGVTWVRDLGGDLERLLELRRAWSGVALRPRITCAGPILDGDPPVWPGISRVCASPEAGRVAVAELAARGVDFVKVYSGLEPDVYRAILAAGEAAGLPVVGHVPDAVPLAEALGLGQAVNEHLMGFAPEIARRLGVTGFVRELGPLKEPPLGLYSRLRAEERALLLAEVREGRMAQCPTLIVLRGYLRAAEADAAEDPRLRFVPPAVRSFWEVGAASSLLELAREAVPHQLTLTGDLHAAGVPILAGTDLANPHVFAGASLHEELELLVEAGLTPAEALRAATLAPARALGLEDELGSIAPGKEASLVLVRGDPLQDIAAAAAIEGVVLRGRYLDRAALDGLVEEAAAAARPPEQDEAPLALSGEELHRGTYRISLGGREVGSEEFVCAATDEGVVFLSRSSGGGSSPPSETRVTGSADLRSFRRATWSTAGASPVAATYALEDGALEVRVTIDGQARPPQESPLDEATIVAPPSYASAPLVVGQAGELGPGETRELSSVSWGFMGPLPVRSAYGLTREEDVDFELGSESVTARHYRFRLTSPLGAIQGEMWLSLDGRLLYQTTLALGPQVLRVTLER